MKLRAIFIVKKEKTMKELPKTYEPRDVEDRLYQFWVDTGYFHAERDPDKKPFTEGTIKMDRDDFQTALGMVYDTFGWDHEKGCPTAACLDQYGMADVKEELDSLGLLP